MYKLILILTSLIATNSFAADMTNLYQSRLAVATQAEDERKNISAELLKSVLLKVVGDSVTLNSTDISAMLANSEHFVQQYQYYQTNKMSDDLTEPERLELELKFKEKELNRAISDLGLPIWGRARPDILMWLVVDDGVERNIISSDQNNTAISIAIKNATDTRGVSIFLPLMDLQDQININTADLWAGFPEPILKASRRYNAPVVVIARITARNDASVQIRWQSLSNGKTEQWQSSGHIETAMALGTTELIDRIARQFTQVVSNQNMQRYELEITDVNSYSDYIRIKKYLENLQYISDVELQSLVAKQLDITVLVSSDLAVLNQTIAIGQVLEQNTAYNPTDKIRFKLIQ